ncbi:MAG: 16S rRNA (uracil(1498)-N(3))-methyltransferase [Candidatus Vogelbacteria bacterium]|nr:16S rRNA (uracil(1498)-N(3))-methyltransferase [Candidatus Vogelbacteria bacterium]
MKLHRFIVGSLSSGQVKLDDLELYNQWKNVLRLEVGALILLTDGQGQEAQATIVSYQGNKILVEVGEVKTVDSGDSNQVFLCCAVLKKENFELVCQKATEIGVSQIIPVLTTRTVKLGLNEERLNKIIKEAAEQSGRVVVPTLNSITTWSEVLSVSSFDHKIIFDKQGDSSEIRAGDKNKKIAILVGPEGGFTNEEIIEARQAGWEIKSLGQNILRGETAAIVATYLAVNNLI